MARIQLIGAVLLCGLAAGTAHAGPPVRWSVGINVGAPAYRPHCYHHYGHHHYWGVPLVHTYPYYYAPAPVIYEPAPVIVQPRPVVVTSPSYSNPTFSAPEPTPAPATPVANQANVDFHLQRLTSTDENVRRESVMELGRARTDRAVDPLTATLAGDRSPAVRDAAARALGLIAAPRSLTALIHASQADNDRDVRHSAQFAVEIIRTNLQRQ